MERALSIFTKKLGRDHPDTVYSRDELEMTRKKARASECIVM